MTVLLIFTAVFLTSLLSGILGMGGGILLAASLAMFVPLSAALLLHASAQFTANSYRALLHKHTIQWRIIHRYSIGMVAVALLFVYWQVTINKSLFYFLLGAMALSSHFIPKNMALDTTKTSHAIASGFLVTALQLFVGVAGPLLDMFYQKTSLNRFQIVATKAMTQAMGHFVRITFYLSVYRQHWQQSEINAWVLLGVIGLAMLGTRAGTSLLHRVNEAQFQFFSRTLLSTLGVFFIAKGAAGIF
ncbi:TSUP family transporter [Reinekea sp. G2M2-21]|uniref:TSUP family transporter n=1 Tax=Reinekea sp. G2M2-21 TaxID=2788942 RepID=UPI0018AC285B|nr:TSUP family transporter [Reinekea sp. G2M2-21]